MKNSELIEKLKKLPPDLEIIIKNCSDYGLVDTIKVEKGIPEEFWVMRYHKSMNKEKMNRVKEYIYVGL